MTWLVEPAAADSDIDEVMAIEEASFSNPWTREMYVAERARVDISYLFVARHHREGEIVGFCAFWLVLDEVHINNLGVAPAHRREGVASALLTRVLQEGARLGARGATLEVRASNQPAIRLYQHFGFRARGVRPAYYTQPIEDALVLWTHVTGQPCA